MNDPPVGNPCPSVRGDASDAASPRGPDVGWTYTSMPSLAARGHGRGHRLALTRVSKYKPIYPSGGHGRGHRLALQNRAAARHVPLTVNKPSQ